MAGQVIRVVVHGAEGRMGREVLAALSREEEIRPVGAVDLKASAKEIPLPEGSGQIPYSSDLSDIIVRCRPQVVVDFSSAEGAVSAARVALPAGVCLVVGSTGLSPQQLKEIEGLTLKHKVGTLVAPNFALGAVLLTYLARLSAPFFDHVEILEAHHEGKADAPSGTAQSIAQAIAAARSESVKRPMPKVEPVKSTRGGELGGVSLHSMRMPGMMAHHEVIFGLQGQTLTLRHDTINRECYIPGVTRAIRHVVSQPGFTLGLDKILGLS